MTKIIELLKIEKALEDCKKNKTDIEKANETLSTKRKDFEAVNRKFQILESAKKFYNDESSFNLWKLSDRINSLSVKIKSETSALNHFEKVTDQNIFQKNAQFEAFKKEKLNKK